MSILHAFSTPFRFGWETKCGRTSDTLTHTEKECGTEEKRKTHTAWVPNVARTFTQFLGVIIVREMYMRTCRVTCETFPSRCNYTHVTSYCYWNSLSLPLHCSGPQARINAVELCASRSARKRECTRERPRMGISNENFQLYENQWICKNNLNPYWFSTLWMAVINNQLDTHPYIFYHVCLTYLHNCMQFSSAQFIICNNNNKNSFQWIYFWILQHVCRLHLIRVCVWGASMYVEFFFFFLFLKCFFCVLAHAKLQHSNKNEWKKKNQYTIQMRTAFMNFQSNKW